MRGRRPAILVAILGCLPLFLGCASFKGSSGFSPEDQAKMLRKRQDAMQATQGAEGTEPSHKATSVTERLRKGDALRRAGEYADAMWEYLRAHELDPSDPDPVARIASLHLMSEPARAEQIFRDLVNDHPDSGAAYTGLGLVLIGRQQWDSAQDALLLAIAKNPNSATAQSALGVCLDRVGEIVEARLAYERALALQPSYYEALNNLGVSYLTTGQFDLAEPYFRRATQLETRDQAVFNNLGLTLGRLKRYDDAFKAFQKAGSEQAARNNVGYVAYLNGNYDRALDEYERALLARGDDRLAVLRNLRAARAAQKKEAAAE